MTAENNAAKNNAAGAGPSASTGRVGEGSAYAPAFTTPLGGVR